MFLEEVVLLFDEVYGVYFIEDIFYYVVCVCFVWGLMDIMMRFIILGVLFLFLDMIVWSLDFEVEGINLFLLVFLYLILICVRVIGFDEFKDSMWFFGMSSEGINGILGY